MSIEKPTTYFEDVGENNTDETLKAAKKRADELEIRDIVVASTRGETGARAVELFKGYNLVVVSHSTGHREPGKQELLKENEEKIRSGGGKILTTGHAFAGVSRAIRRKFDTVGPAELVAQTLRIFGDGMKVCLECAAMAADAGLIPVDRDVISIGGTGRGADTAIVLKPAHLSTSTSNLFDTFVREIIAKPNVERG